MAITSLKRSLITTANLKYDSFLAGNIVPAGSYQAITTATVDSGGASSITFSSIPQTYTHLQIRGIARGSGTGGILVTFNSDTGTNYSYHSLTGDGSTVSSNNATSTSNMLIVRNGGIQTGTSIFSGVVVDVLDYVNTNKYKTLRTLNGGDANGSGNVQIESGAWRSSAAINSITLTHNGTGFAQYSTFALYGVQ